MLSEKDDDDDNGGENGPGHVASVKMVFEVHVSHVQPFSRDSTILPLTQHI